MMHNDNIMACVLCCSVYCIYRVTHIGTLCSSCATPPCWRPADGTGLVSVCGTEMWWGRLLTKLTGTYPGPIFLSFSLHNTKTTPSVQLPVHSAFRWSRTDRFQLHCARREPAGALPLHHPQKLHLSSSMSP